MFSTNITAAPDAGMLPPVTDTSAASSTLKYAVGVPCLTKRMRSLYGVAATQAPRELVTLRDVVPAVEAQTPSHTALPSDRYRMSTQFCVPV